MNFENFNMKNENIKCEMPIFRFWKGKNFSNEKWEIGDEFSNFWDEKWEVNFQKLKNGNWEWNIGIFEM